MVNPPVTDARDAERELAIGYAPPERRNALRALLALDERLGEAADAGRAPIAAQLRLAWWRDALAALGDGPAPPEPVLAALNGEVIAHGIAGGELAAIAMGWEQLLADPLDRAAMLDFAAGRGGTLFAIAARLLGEPSGDVAAVGEGWALADLARRARDGAVTAAAAVLAHERWAAAAPGRCPRALRPLGALALTVRADLAGRPAGSPRRVARLAWHRLTGL